MSSFYSDAGSDLREQMHRLASFNRHVAHDLRGPLGSVASAAHLAQQALARGDDRSADRLLRLVAAGAEDLTQLLADLLALAQAHDAPLTQSTVDLTELARSAIDQVRLASDGTSHTFNLHALPTVTGAPGLLRQVFVNLLGNAVKFSRPVDAPTIDVGCAAVSGQRVIYVKDKASASTAPVRPTCSSRSRGCTAANTQATALD